MPKKKKIPSSVTKIKNCNSKIDTSLYETNYDDRNGRVVFSSVSHNRCCISEWHGNELIQLIDTFKLFESLKWKEIFRHTGLKWERNPNIAIKLPQNLPKDIKLCSFRVNDKMRVYGYRAQEYFYIVWFDKNHIVCPLGKNKSYTA